MFFTGKIITSLNFADGTYEKRQLKMFKEIGRLVQYICPVHSYYWPSPFVYTKVPESDYSEKPQKTLGVFGNFSVIY